MAAQPHFMEAAAAQLDVRRMTTTSRALWQIVCVLSISAPAAGQTWPPCAALNCQDEAVTVIAVDSLLREGASRGFPACEGPRIWRSVHASPFRREGRLSPPIDELMTGDMSLIRRRWPGFAVVDSATVVRAGGVELTPGGPVVILAPVTWLGEHSVRVRLAIYHARIDYGEEWFVLLRREAGQWRIVRVEAGWAN